MRLRARQILLLLAILSPAVLFAREIDTTYQLSPERQAHLEQKLQTMLQAMRKPDDPPMVIKYSTERQIDAYVEIDYQNPSKPSVITISRGLLEFIRSEDELAFVIAHEMSHTTAIAKRRTVTEHLLQRNRDEIILADLGAIERMIAAGYDPVAGREFFVKLLEKGIRLNSPLLSAVVDHPPDELRVTSIDVDLKRKHDKAAFPERVGDPDGWLEKYRASFVPPWSLSEKRPKNFKTLLDRLLTLTSLKDLPPAQQVAFVSRYLFSRDYNLENVRQVIITGMLYDPHVNPGPTIDALVYNFQRNQFDLKPGLTYPPETNHFAPGGKHVFSGGDIEYLFQWMKTTAAANQDFASRSTITRSMHDVAHGWGVPFISGQFRPRHLPQILWRLKPERLLKEQAALLDISKIDVDLEAFKTNGHLYPVELQVEALLRYAEKNSKLTVEENDYIFQSLCSVSDRFWTVDQANRYLAVLPRIHERYWSDRRALPSSEWPGQRRNTSDRGEEYAAFSASSRAGAGTRKYIQSLIGRTDVPLGLRLQLSAYFLRRPWWNDRTWQRSVTEARTFLDGLEAARSVYQWRPGELDGNFERGEGTFHILLGNAGWKYTPEDVVDIFETFDFSWLERRTKNQELIVKDAHGKKHSFRLPHNSGEAFVKKLRENGENSLADSLEKANEQLKNSSYQYNLQASEKLQRRFWNRLKELGRIPTNPVMLSRLHQALSRVGNTEFTDGLAEEIYLKQAKDCPQCLKDALDKNSIWDFDLRKKVYELWYKQGGDKVLTKAHSRPELLENFLSQIQKWFPEPSYERARVIEDFSHAVRTNYREAKILEDAKYSSDHNHEAVSLRIFSAVFTEMVGDRKNRKRPMQFVQFLIGNGEFPKLPEKKLVTEQGQKILDPVTGKVMKTRGLTSELFGPARTKRLFESLSPETKAVAIAPFFAKPQGLLSHRDTREEIYRTILSGVEPEFRKDARLLMEALLHGQRMVAPFEENLTLAYLFAQSSHKNRSGGAVLKDLLQSQGAVGISLGQKLYQRRLVPDKYLAEIGDLQDMASPPTRFEAITRAVEVLDLKDPDAEVTFGSLLGAASAKIVMEIYHHDGEDAAKRQALKMLREHFSRRLDLEEAKLRASVQYLEEHGGPKFRSMGPLVEDLVDTLRKQSDLGKEALNEFQVKQLYRHGEIDQHGFRWLVSSPSGKRSASKIHAQEDVIDGQTVRGLKGPDRARVAASIFDKDFSILLEGERHADEDIFFERDRHMGNYMVKLKKQPPEIHVIDYPLLTSIKGSDRDAIFKLIGLLELAKNYRQAPQTVLDEMCSTLEKITKTPPQRNRLQENVKAFIAGRAKGDEPTTRLLNLFSSLQKDKMQISDTVYAYLTALGHLEGVAKEAGASYVERFRGRMLGMVKNDAMATIDKMSWRERCSLLMRQFFFR